MTNNDEFIGQLESYLEEFEGLTPLPATVRDAIRAELPTTKQNGPVPGLMRDTFVSYSMDSPARWGLAAAVVIGAVIIGGALIFGDNVGGPGPSPSATQEPTTAPPTAAFAPEDLPAIVLTPEASLPGLTVEHSEQGPSAYAAPFPEGFVLDYTGFGDALMTSINSTDGGGLVSWAVVFGTEGQASDAFALIRRAHEEPDGWGLEPVAVSGLGPDGVSYVGAGYVGFDVTTSYFWRVGNLVLAAVALGDADPQLARDIADEMQARTQSP